MHGLCFFVQPRGPFLEEGTTIFFQEIEVLAREELAMPTSASIIMGLSACHVSAVRNNIHGMLMLGNVYAPYDK